MSDYFRGDNAAARKAAEILNPIVDMIDNNKNYKRATATMYLGDKQRWALSVIDIGNPTRLEENESGKTFMGFKVVWVLEESYMQLAH